MDILIMNKIVCYIDFVLEVIVRQTQQYTILIDVFILAMLTVPYTTHYNFLTYLLSSIATSKRTLHCRDHCTIYVSLNE